MPSRNRLNTALVSALLFLLSGRVVADSVLYVDDDAPPGGNGTNWESAYRFLHDTGIPDGQNPPIDMGAHEYLP